MAHALARLLPVEMAVLGLFELTLSFVLIFVMLSAGGPPALLESTALTRDCLVLAAILTVTIAGIAATIGLYRPEVCLHRGRFMLTGTVAALFAFPAILLISRAWHLTLSGNHVMWLAWLTAVWLLVMLLFRYAVSVVALRVPLTRRVLIVGTGPRADDLRWRLAAERHWLFEPIAPDAAPAEVLFVSAPRLGSVSAPRSDSVSAPRSGAHAGRQRRIWGVVIAGGQPEGAIQTTLLDQKLRGVPVYNDVSFQEQHLGRIALEGVDANWLLFSDGFRNGGLSDRKSVV